MPKGTFRIADHVFCICSVYEEVQKMCGNYISTDEPEFVITTNEEDIRLESEMSDHNRQFEGLPPYTFADSYLETLAVYRKLVERLADDDIILFHGSAIAVEGQCYLFTAKSGTGKSTHVRLWRKMLGDRAVMVNDDKPLIRLKDGMAVVYGTPWDGKHHLSTNISMPLKSIAVLKRGEKNSIVPLGIKESLPMLIQQTYRPDNPQAVMKVLQLVGKLAQSVNLFELHCNMEDEAAHVAYEGMSK